MQQGAKMLGWQLLERQVKIQKEPWGCQRGGSVSSYLALPRLQTPGTGEAAGEVAAPRRTLLQLEWLSSSTSSFYGSNHSIAGIFPQLRKLSVPELDAR